MGALTEIEIFDQMAQSLRVAAELCDDLAVNQIKGPTYVRFREQLKLIDGCCRQASVWREDTRWLDLANLAFQAHQKAGGWLRGVRLDPNLPRVRLAKNHYYQVFTKLAENLRLMLRGVEDLKTKRTGRVGMILPAPLVDRNASVHRRQHVVQAPAGMRFTKSGLIVPSDVAA